MCASGVETVESVNKLISFIADSNKYFHVPLTASSNTGYLVTQPIRIAYFKHVIALDQSEGWI